MGLFWGLLWAAGGSSRHRGGCCWANRFLGSAVWDVLSCPCMRNLKLSPLVAPLFLILNSTVTKLGWLSHFLFLFWIKTQVKLWQILFCLLSFQDLFSAADCCDEYWSVVSGGTVKEPEESWFDVGSTAFHPFIRLICSTSVCGLTLDSSSCHTRGSQRHYCAWWNSGSRHDFELVGFEISVIFISLRSRIRHKTHYIS